MAINRDGAEEFGSDVAIYQDDIVGGASFVAC